jgi:8-oxo-dGTP pyrophosphatase MutT (NUDIX family)
MAINQKLNFHILIICANIFVRKDGKFLLIKRSAKKMYAPGIVHAFGGKVDQGENPFVAAQREVYEEAGVKVKNMRLKAVLLDRHPENPALGDWLIYHFTADYSSGRIKTTEEGEAVLMSAAELKRQRLFPSTKKVLRYILDPKQGTAFATFIFNRDLKITKSWIDRCAK